jgi:hypothetical protein
MPQDGLFFRVLRRFNIVMATLIGLSLIAFVGWHLYKTPHLRREVLGQPVASPVSQFAWQKTGMSVDPENYGTLVLSRNTPFPVAGTPDAFENYVPKQVLNVMVLDEKTGAGHWLFADNKQTIPMRDALYEGAPVAHTTPYEGAPVAHTTPSTDTRPVLGMVMVVVPEAQAKAAKTQVIYAWTKRLGDAKKLVEMDEIVSIGQPEENRYVVIYRKGKALKSATYSVPDFKLLSEIDLPAAPK